jgi:hypothetical protein
MTLLRFIIYLIGGLFLSRQGILVNEIPFATVPFYQSKLFIIRRSKSHITEISPVLMGGYRMYPANDGVPSSRQVKFL